MTEFYTLDIESTKKLLKNGDISCEDLVNHSIAQANRHKDKNIFITETFEQAIQQAKAADIRYQNGKELPLDGITVGVKDLFCTKNIKTTAASKMLYNFIPPYDSTVSNKLITSGGIMLGKVNMDEFAMGSSNTTSYFGNVINPWKGNKEENLVPGGSSGGSAAVVAARITKGSIGSDTGGSIRQPASFTGTVGFKPSYGRCSRYGMVAFSSSLDQAGVFANSMLDSAHLLQAIMGYDRNDSTSADLPVPDLVNACKNHSIKGMTIGVPYEILENDQLAPEIVQMCYNCIDVVKSAGANIINVKIPYSEYAIPLYYITACAEAASNLARYDGIKFGYRTTKNNLSLEEIYTMTRSEGFGEEVKRRILLGTYILSKENIQSYYFKAQNIRREIKRSFENIYKTCQGIILPSAPSSAFPINKVNNDDPVLMYFNDIFTIPASLAGLATVSVPAFIDKKGLPLGLQVVSNNFDEISATKIARTIEKGLNLNFIPKGI